MNEKILVVEDQFIEANNLQMILERAGYRVCTIARSVPVALDIIEKEKPDLVLLDIYLQGNQTGIDLAHMLKEKNIAFVYLSANSNKDILDAAKATQPYGFLVKPFREKDVLVTLDIARYLHEHSLESRLRRDPGLQNHLSDLFPEPGKQSAAEPLQETVFKGIIGASKKLKEVLDHLVIVAPLETSVLIHGESGTGKERIADCIHNLSPRKMKPLIKVNCAALPATLIESELFGHERGAFTGAFERKTGKFEQAQEGTIFLDEIGELPFDLQVKLLRVLQEKEIERIGGKQSIKLNVRIIAATNRNLEKEVAEGRFRIDLYYRLNVFPILLPPLRERKEDIPVLAKHFSDYHSRKIGKKITAISEKAMRDMIEYDWPGNIRELEHLLERSVLLARDYIITEVPIPRGNPKEPPIQGGEERIKSMDENERDHILSVLRKCNGKIFGQGGAAELLGIHVSTLNSKIKKLGIEKETFISRK